MSFGHPKKEKNEKTIDIDVEVSSSPLNLGRSPKGRLSFKIPSEGSDVASSPSPRRGRPRTASEASDRSDRSRASSAASRESFDCTKMCKPINTAEVQQMFFEMQVHIILDHNSGKESVYEEYEDNRSASRRVNTFHGNAGKCSTS